MTRSEASPWIWLSSSSRRLRLLPFWRYRECRPQVDWFERWALSSWYGDGSARQRSNMPASGWVASAFFLDITSTIARLFQQARNAEGIHTGISDQARD